MKMNKFPLFVILIAAAALASCKKKENEDLTNTVNKNGSVETSVTVQPLDSTHDVLLTKHTVWVHNNQFKNIEYRDTIPALGTETKEAENSNGDTKKVTLKKDYEIFITIK
jgi:hypothetical protein